jgi:indolepyruvate ferredoxin oxidoreductase
MMKPLRGTAFDPFGYTRVRRTERELVGEYRAMIEGALATLSEETYERSVELAALPDMIRGYEEIKLASVEQYRARAQDLIQQRSDGRARAAMQGEAR